MGYGRKIRRKMLKRKYEELDASKLSDNEIAELIKKLNTLREIEIEEAIDNRLKHKVVKDVKQE